MAENNLYSTLLYLFYSVDIRSMTVDQFAKKGKIQQNLKNHFKK